jgi:hypothetical protein
MQIGYAEVLSPGAYIHQVVGAVQNFAIQQQQVLQQQQMHQLQHHHNGVVWHH